MDIKSAQEKSNNLGKEKYLRAIAKMRIMQAYGQFMINERRTGASYLQDAYKELNQNLQSVVES